MDKKKNQQKLTQEPKKESLVKKEEPKREFPKRKVTWAGGVNIRKEPSLKTEVITVYPFNFIYEVLESKKVEDEEWLKVKDGWTMAAYGVEVK